MQELHSKLKGNSAQTLTAISRLSFHNLKKKEKVNYNATHSKVIHMLQNSLLTTINISTSATVRTLVFTILLTGNFPSSSIVLAFPLKWKYNCGIIKSTNIAATKFQRQQTFRIFSGLIFEQNFAIEKKVKSFWRSSKVCHNRKHF